MNSKDVRIEADSDYIQLFKALAHPVRLELLSIMGYRDISPKEFALHRGEPISKVSHHFRELEKLNCIELVRTRPVRGSTEHIYRRIRRIVFSDRDWLLLPDEARQIIASTTLRELVGQITQALQAGTVTTRPNPHFSWWRMRLDEQGWKEVTVFLKHTFDAVVKAQEGAAERMRKSGEQGFEATIALLAFESPPEDRWGVGP
ncbi:MAG TPA: hypothetical protein VNN15_02875 [Solirubrobacterales bacterium]|nr:hypothetical protein [Solirubrobacterales bacterium]